MSQLISNAEADKCFTRLHKIVVAYVEDVILKKG